MSTQFSNVLPLSPGGKNESTKLALFSELNQLVHEIICPEIDALFSVLSSNLESHLEEITNDQDMMRWVDIKNRLNKSESLIQNSFIEHLTSTDKEQSSQQKSVLTLELLDNSELDHQLLWHSAANNFVNSKNAERICRIKSSLENTYPQHEGTYPATRERVCESFSKALENLQPDRDIEQQLFIWFARHLNKTADQLWLKVDQLLINKGLEPKHLSPVRRSENNTVPAPDHHPVSAPRSMDRIQTAPKQGHYPDIANPEFLDSLAEKLISRLEDMLAEDELIPEAKANRVKTIDLANVLSSLQLEVLEQHVSIRNLHNSVIDALEVQGVNSNLSRHHEDLINMVGWLFEYILDDHHLPDDVKKTMALLQIPILKQAILDDDFLTHNKHPARRLLNNLTSAGILYCRDTQLSKHVLLLIEYTVRTIISDHNENPNIFQDCLDGFQFNLNIILQPEVERSEKQNHATEPSEQPEEMQVTASSDDNTIDFRSENFKKEDSELGEEIILSCGQSGLSLNNSPLSELNPEATEDSQELELVPNEPNDEADAQGHHSSFAPVIIDGLHPGQWVEFIGEGDSHRLCCKLARLSKDSHRYIFVNRSGMRIAERSGSDLKKGIEDGSIRVMADNPVFDRAIQAVLERFKKRL
ncbi:DUF1631 family protein [Endozoicomonas sp. SCSIO W0465]|uniref:DUF1631 family protein n=1 Tax=Endozoicomonas sp. SCSIO W0465 TaxID=2918516 RepID=UPI0020750F6A|nr:DUF1631 family protein [Endozoicomonas sp. SCSIO W0465]USE35257.1 DUF1631 domain-containing protein [Endozoicomonas sp. SCSIO W0465]